MQDMLISTAWGNRGELIQSINIVFRIVLSRIILAIFCIVLKVRYCVIPVLFTKFSIRLFSLEAGLLGICAITK